MRTYIRAVGAVFAFALVVIVAAPGFARGDEQSNLIAQKSLHAAEIAAQEENAAKLSNEASHLESELKGIAGSLTQTSERLGRAQANVAHLISFQYRSGMKAGLLDVILSSKNWDDLNSRVTYASKVNAFFISSVQAVKDEQAALQTQKHRLIDLMRQKQENADKAQQVIQQLREKNIQIDSRLEKLAKQAAAEKAAQEAARKAADQAKQSLVQETPQKSYQPPSAVEQPRTGDAKRPDSGSVDHKPSSVPTGSVETTETPSNSSDGTWQTGIASAYDDVGEPVALFPLCLDETTPTVAVPMAWKNHRSYLGRYLKITYGSKTIVARCTDCGYMANGARSLDLSPACYRAFGASTAIEWGVRRVSFAWL